MALPPRGERFPSEMNEGTDYGYKGYKGPTYGLGALGLLGPSPSAQFYIFCNADGYMGTREYRHAYIHTHTYIHTRSTIIINFVNLDFHYFDLLGLIPMNHDETP
jgi:hypothetical protein